MCRHPTLSSYQMAVVGDQFISLIDLRYSNRHLLRWPQMQRVSAPVQCSIIQTETNGKR